MENEKKFHDNRVAILGVKRQVEFGWKIVKMGESSFKLNCLGEFIVVDFIKGYEFLKFI